MARRVLFLSAPVGVGHTAAARAVESALLACAPDIETRTVDSYEYAASVFAKIVADGYIGMVRTVPQVYAYLYGRVERANNIPSARAFVNTYTAANLRSYLERFRPDLVVCTHAFPCGVMSEYKRRFDAALPVVGVVTDFVVHPFWIYPNIDTYAVATPEMRRLLIARGIEPERILLSGIPIDARFGRPHRGKEGLRQALGLPRERHIVLIMAGGIGIGPIEAMMRALGKVPDRLAATVIVGRNGRRQKRVLGAAEHTAYPLRVLGFVENVYDYMHASDVLLSKPGGLTSSEALAARLPMVLVKPLPGPEERNTRYLVERGAAVETTRSERLAGAVSDLLGSTARRRALQDNIENVRRPDAATAVAQRILDLLANGARTPKEGRAVRTPMVADVRAGSGRDG